jgi:hypothetical protein
MFLKNPIVIPAKAGIFILRNAEIPAFAGMTEVFEASVNCNRDYLGVGKKSVILREVAESTLSAPLSFRA